MDLKELYNNGARIFERHIINGNTYDVPFNQEKSYYANAGSCDDPMDALSYLISSKFSETFDEDGNPIFDLTYVIPIDGAIQVGVDGFILIPNDNEELIFSDSLEVKDNKIVLHTKGIPTCLWKANNSSDYCYFDVEDDGKILSSILHINISKDDYQKIDHKCGPQFIYEAELGSISINSNDAFTEFFENVELDYFLEDLAEYDADGIMEDLQGGMGNYITKEINGEEYIVFGMFHEDWIRAI